MGTLEGFVESRQASGVTNSSINRELASLRQVLTRAARVWRHENNLPYLDTAPLIEMLENDDRTPYQIGAAELRALLQGMNAANASYALFLVNTGGRCNETLNLKWEWELKGYPAFLVPAEFHKNKRPRLLVCNSVAWKIVEAQRGNGERVFDIHHEGFRMAWDRARMKAGLSHIRRHDLKHTFGMRLRAAGVSFEDRQDLLGHTSSRITDHYCQADIQNLIDAAEKVVGFAPEPALRVVGVKNMPNLETETPERYAGSGI
jgi:integrase